MRNKRFVILLLSLLFLGFQFPKDHTFHNEFALEWVYFVGHIHSDSGDTFGYELSFFRHALQSDASVPPIEIFPVHFAISHPKTKRHVAFESLKRTIGGLAGYNEKEIYSGDYRFDIISEDVFKISAKPKFQNTWLELELSSTNKPLLHGENGKSIKSRKNPSIFSYYYSYPRLSTKGRLSLEGNLYTISSGDSWMDHEWSGKETSKFTFASKSIAWDWLSISTDNGFDFVGFTFKGGEGQPTEVTGILRGPDGKIQKFESDERIQMIADKDGIWKSAKTSIEYPLTWRINFPNGFLTVNPVFKEQEFDGRMSTGLIYWEGMVIADGIIDGKKTKGKGYLELKGYDKNKVGVKK